jgi:hypothetical protein
MSWQRKAICSAALLGAVCFVVWYYWPGEAKEVYPAAIEVDRNPKTLPSTKDHPPDPGRKITEASFNRINNFMDFKQVQRILGDPTQLNAVRLGVKEARWQKSEDPPSYPIITIVFKVEGKREVLESKKIQLTPDG